MGGRRGGTKRKFDLFHEAKMEPMAIHVAEIGHWICLARTNGWRLYNMFV